MLCLVKIIFCFTLAHYAHSRSTFDEPIYELYFFPIELEIHLTPIDTVCLRQCKLFERKHNLPHPRKAFMKHISNMEKSFFPIERKKQSVLLLSSVCNMRSLCLCLHPPRYYVLKDNHRCNIHQFALIDSTTPHMLALAKKIMFAPQI